MRRLTQAPNIAIAALWADALQQAGFSASVQRYFLSGIAGELPPDQCLPEIWLTHDDEEPAARALLAVWRRHARRVGLSASACAGPKKKRAVQSPLSRIKNPV